MTFDFFDTSDSSYSVKHYSRSAVKMFYRYDYSPLQLNLSKGDYGR